MSTIACTVKTAVCNSHQIWCAIVVPIHTPHYGCNYNAHFSRRCDTLITHLLAHSFKGDMHTSICVCNTLPIKSYLHAVFKLIAQSKKMLTVNKRTKVN